MKAGVLEFVRKPPDEGHSQFGTLRETIEQFLFRDCPCPRSCHCGRVAMVLGRMQRCLGQYGPRSCPLKDQGSARSKVSHQMHRPSGYKKDQPNRISLAENSLTRLELMLPASEAT